MNQNLQGTKIAILTTNGFEQSELTEPLKQLRAMGAEVDVVAPEGPKVKAWDKKDWGIDVPVDRELSKARAEDYDAIVLPGGVINPDQLRINEQAVKFVRHFADSKKPIAAVCHGPQTLIETGVVKGRQMTSWASLKTDLTNAGAKWVDKEVVVDGNLVTSRKPDDLPAFIRETAKLVESVKATA